MKKIWKFCSRHKKELVLLIVVLLMASPMFASADSAKGEMNKAVGNIVDFFSNKWVRGLACIALIAECLGLLFAGGQNPQIFKKFLPLLAGTVIFMCAGKIVTIIFDQTPDFTNDLEMTTELLPDQMPEPTLPFAVRLVA